MKIWVNIDVNIIRQIYVSLLIYEILIENSLWFHQSLDHRMKTIKMLKTQHQLHVCTSKRDNDRYAYASHLKSFHPYKIANLWNPFRIFFLTSSFFASIFYISFLRFISILKFIKLFKLESIRCTRNVYRLKILKINVLSTKMEKISYREKFQQIKVIVN